MTTNDIKKLEEAIDHDRINNILRILRAKAELNQEEFDLLWKANERLMKDNRGVDVEKLRRLAPEPGRVVTDKEYAEYETACASFIILNYDALMCLLRTTPEDTKGDGLERFDPNQLAVILTHLSKGKKAAPWMVNVLEGLFGAVIDAQQPEHEGE